MYLKTPCPEVTPDTYEQSIPRLQFNARGYIYGAMVDNEMVYVCICVQHDTGVLQIFISFMFSLEKASLNLKGFPFSESRDMSGYM